MKQTGRIEQKSMTSGCVSRAGSMLFGLLLVCFFCILILPESRNAKAAGAMIEISTRNNTITKGDTIYVVITVSSSDAIKGFEGHFTYNSRVLRFETGGSITHGNDDTFRINDTNRTSSANKITYSVKFTARQTGSASIFLKKPYHVYMDDDSSSEMSVSFNTLNILVKSKKAAEQKPKKTKEPETTKEPEATKEPETTQVPPAEATIQPSAAPTPNAKDVPGSNLLRKLSIDGIEFAPNFAPKIKKYSAIATTDDKSLAISYETKDSMANVTIKGNKNLKQGKNIIKVIVKGTDGKKSVYRLSLNIQRTDGSSGNSHVTAVKKKGKLYLLGDTEIEVLDSVDEELIPEGFVEEETTIAGKKVTAYALESGVENSFVLIYGKGKKEELYLYDWEEGQLMPYEKVKAWYRSMNGESVKNTTSEERMIQSLKYVIGIMAAFCGLLLLILISIAFHSRRN